MPCTNWHGPVSFADCYVADLFLPSYANEYDAQEHEHRQDPVHDIVLSDEEAAAILPQ